MAKEPRVYVRRQWNDDQVGSVRMSSLQGLCLDIKSGDIGSVAPRPFLHAYILCTDVTGGKINHWCREAAPHRIKVCIVPKDNTRKINRTLRRQIGPSWLGKLWRRVAH